MKTCNVCSLEKPVSEFNKRAAAKDGLMSLCKSCRRQKYDEHPEKVERGKAKYARNRNLKGKFVDDYLKSHPCVDCGEADPVVLEFDHLRDKVLPISRMVNYGYSLETIAAEIAKCEVRCCNCHRRVTAKRGNWKSYLER